MKRIWLFLVMVLCLAFAVRTLLLIDATALWSDELYSVGKSFQSSFTSVLVMLREDTHPPAYSGSGGMWSVKVLLACARCLGWRISPGAW